MNRRIKYLGNHQFPFLMRVGSSASDRVSGGRKQKEPRVREVFLEEELAYPELVLSKSNARHLFIALALGTLTWACKDSGI